MKYGKKSAAEYAGDALAFLHTAERIPLKRAAHLVGTHYHTILDWARSGLLPTVTIGKTRFLLRQNVSVLVELAEQRRRSKEYPENAAAYIEKSVRALERRSRLDDNAGDGA